MEVFSNESVFVFLNDHVDNTSYTFRDLGPVVQRMDNAIHRINHYPVDSVVCFVDTYPLDSYLSSG